MENTEILSEEINNTYADLSETVPEYQEPELTGEESLTDTTETDVQMEKPEAQAEVNDEAETLRRELYDLRAYVEDQRVKEEKALHELEEFGRLYPEIGIDSIDESVWERVRDGLPLSAAYALCEREKELQRNFADQINTRNSQSSAGSAGTPPRLDYFSPDEVKAMSGAEVRQNYANIRRSMNYWRKATK